MKHVKYFVERRRFNRWWFRVFHKIPSGSLTLAQARAELAQCKLCTPPSVFRIVKVTTTTEVVR